MNTTEKITERELEDRLSTPGEADVEAFRRMEGDLIVLGSSGKMGPTLVRLARRAATAAGSAMRIFAVGRSRPLNLAGVEDIPADLLDPDQVESLPAAANVVYMVGRKFGSTGDPALTWAINALAPALVARRFVKSRIVAFSTGNVYPFVPVTSGGATEETTTEPVGEYAQSALARERIFEYYSARQGTPVVLLRLNYAVEPRYGVLVDIAQRVQAGLPVDLSTGHVNVIWQADANSLALRALSLCRVPARVLNLTGPECLPVRWLAEEFGRRLCTSPKFTGSESETALLSNAAVCHRELGAPRTGISTMLDSVAEWLAAGGATLNKPTHFETRSGRF